MVKIPKNAKQVYKGTVFEIYQWKQKMFGSKTKTFEVAKRLDGVALIATVKDKIVILKEKQPTTSWFYTLPGGYLDMPHEETAREGALRELLEETGLKPKKLIQWMVDYGGARVQSKFYVFIARDCEKIQQPKLDGGELIKMELKTFDQFLKMSDNPNFKNRETVIELLKARLSTKAKAKLKKQIFG